MLPPECCRRARGALWRKAPERIRSIPCAKAVRCARAAIAPTHVEHKERRSARARSAMSGTRNAKYCAKLVSAVELLLSAALSRSAQLSGDKRLSCSREWSQNLTAPRKPRRKAETVPAALEARLTSPPGGLHATDSSPHVTVRSSSGRGAVGAATAVYRNSYLIKIQILKVRHNSARRQSEQGRGRDGRGRARGPARFNLHGSSVCPRPPSPPAHQCAAGAGARRVADAMRASSRPAWGTRHE